MQAEFIKNKNKGERRTNPGHGTNNLQRAVYFEIIFSLQPFENMLCLLLRAIMRQHEIVEVRQQVKEKSQAGFNTIGIATVATQCCVEKPLLSFHVSFAVLSRRVTHPLLSLVLKPA